MKAGIILAGGGALLKGLDERLRDELRMPIHVAEKPLSCVVEGAGACLERFDSFRQVFVGGGARKL